MSRDQLRASQVVTTFGPGAMVDLPEASILVAGLDHWHYDLNQIPMVEEPRLVAKLRDLLGIPSLTLRRPPPANDFPGGPRPSVTGWRFPAWFIVQRTEFSARGHRRRRLVPLSSLNNNRFTDRDGKKLSVVPVRFVRACTRGHIGDIDWKAFVHGEGDSCVRDLWLEERGTTGELDDVIVACDCSKTRAMSQAARLALKALGSCNGARPWLGPGTREACGEPNRLLIRSASNAYFAETLSVISIPDSRSPIDDLVRGLWDDFLSDVETAADLVKVRAKPTVQARLAGADGAQILVSIQRVRAGGAGLDRSVKEVEFEALSEAREGLGVDEPDGVFFARALPGPAWQASWMAAVDRVVLVHRLREVVAQVGFTRFEAASTDTEGELALDVKRALLGLNAQWLPAIENKGEGVFLSFRPDLIDAWAERPAVQARGRELLAGFDRWKKDHDGSKREFPGLPYVMLHTFSHLLLTAISLECGYPASSLRERVYAAPGRYGVLILTGSSDAEGTLGGLVLAGRDIRRHLHRALASGALCSNDPVCAFHSPARHDHQPLLGGACHGCVLASETSCEQRNDFLDRSLVVPTLQSPDAAFFPRVGL